MKYSITVLIFNTTTIGINSLMEIQKGCANLPIKLRSSYLVRVLLHLWQHLLKQENDIFYLLKCINTKNLEVIDINYYCDCISVFSYYLYLYYFSYIVYLLSLFVVVHVVLVFLCFHLYFYI